MKLTKLRMRLIDYGDRKGQYEGEVTFEDHATTFTTKINTGTCQRYLDLVRESIIEAASELGTEIAESLKAADAAGDE